MLEQPFGIPEISPPYRPHAGSAPVSSEEPQKKESWADGVNHGLWDMTYQIWNMMYEIYWNMKYERLSIRNYYIAYEIYQTLHMIYEIWSDMILYDMLWIMIFDLMQYDVFFLVYQVFCAWVYDTWYLPDEGLWGGPDEASPSKRSVTRCYKHFTTAFEFFNKLISAG